MAPQQGPTEPDKSEQIKEREMWRGAGGDIMGSKHLFKIINSFVHVVKK